MPDGFSAHLAALGRDEIARRLAHLCDAVEAAESSALVPADRDSLAFFASTNAALAGGSAPPVPIGASFTGLAFRSGQTIALADAAHQPGHFKGVDALVAGPTREFAAVPMLDARGTVVGVLTLANRRAAPSPRAGQPFSPDDLAEAARTATDLAGGVAALVALARTDVEAGASRDTDLAAEIAALGERDRRSVRALVDALTEIGSSDDAHG